MGAEPRPPFNRSGSAVALVLTSSAFEDGAPIPREHTCDGADTSPPLSWEGLPPGTQSVALIVDDPDAPDPNAPQMTWVHWVLYNLPPDTTSLPGGLSAEALPRGSLEGLNDWKRTGYRGPCPPIGRHRYFHKLYALDVVLPDLGRPTTSALEAAMEGHLLGRAEIVGTYKRARG